MDTLRNVLQREADGLAMDLKNVSFVDRDGVELLALTRIVERRLRNCPAYVCESIARERAESKANSREQGIEGSEDTKDF